ncbi:hypothetical protein KCP73_08755 [Salmonella enterica subsp. enterica]|nr:hypothetical protein KCP73_08755 [Salmonella enterica subsp. enterica]
MNSRKISKRCSGAVPQVTRCWRNIKDQKCTAPRRSSAHLARRKAPVANPALEPPTRLADDRRPARRAQATGSARGAPCGTGAAPQKRRNWRNGVVAGHVNLRKW